MIDASNPPPVFIVEVTALGVDRTDWLCQACVEKRIAAGAKAKVGSQVERVCDDCWRTWKSPPVTPAPPSPNPRLPTPEECPRPKSLERWPERLARLKAEHERKERKGSEEAA